MKIYDFSLPMEVGMPVFPETEPVDIKYSHNIEEHSFKMGQVILNSHAGTHCDAPAHFLLNGKGLEHWKLERCVGHARILNFSHKKPKEPITVNDLAPYENVIEPGARLLIRTDWGEHFGKDSYFSDYPPIAIEAAKWLVEKKVGLLGLEHPSINPECPEVIHKLLLGGDIMIIESLTNLRSVKSDVIFFVGAPINFKDADGIALRAFGIEF